MKVSSNSLMERISAEQVKAMLERKRAVITGGHFVYAKPTDRGDHGSCYVNKDIIYTDPECISALCLEMAWRLRDHRVDKEVTVIVGPEKGGIILSNMTAFFHDQLKKNRTPGNHRIRSAFAEKKLGGGFEFKRGYDRIVRGQNVVVVEDIMNSGGSAAETVTAVREAGGDPVGVVAICNRGGVTAEMVGVPFLESLISFAFDKYPEDKCPLCDADVPVNEDLGHGRQFMARMRQQP
jgi:orotate phosphoribosyltransferase